MTVSLKHQKYKTAKTKKNSSQLFILTMPNQCATNSVVNKELRKSKENITLHAFEQ